MFQTGYKENEEHRMAISKKLDAGDLPTKRNPSRSKNRLPFDAILLFE